MDGGKTQVKPPNPRARANPLSALTFSWTLPIFWRGYKREMEVEDLYEPLQEHASGELGARLARLWAREATRAKPSLLRVLLQAFAARAALYGLVLFVMECILRLAQPVFLGRLIAYYTPTQSDVSRAEAYWSAGAVIACSAINVLVAHPYMMAILHVGMKMRVACCSLIYRKSLRLSKSALGETTVGQVVNLLSNDVNRFDVAVIFVHYLWIGPLATLLITYFMYREIGYSAVVGVAFMLAFIPLQAYLGKRTSVLRLRTALRTDERVRLMNEIIAGVQVIKMYTWEKPFADLVAKARKHEIKQIRATSYIRGVLTSFVMFTTRISLFTSVLAYVLLGDNVTAEKVFVVTSYYNILRQTMTVFFPQGIAQIAEANISVKRLEKFMLYDETTKPIPAISDIIGKVPTPTKPGPQKKGKEKKVAAKKDEETKEKDGDEKRPSEQKIENGSSVASDVETSGNGLAPLASTEDDVDVTEPTSKVVAFVPPVVPDPRVDGIQLHNACAAWTLGAPDYTLSDITLSVKPGMLVGIVGAVGAGKSSLLQVLLQELPLLRGTVHVGGEVSYAGQEPWLFAGSVRQNILFGASMDRPRYNTVVRRCALDRDFALLPRGDKTIVGERGVSLSGGQRARISLARAVYKRADVYLLDDPLSAVDTRVARHLFESCISGYLSGTTRLLVTHQLQFLKEVHQIVILKNGEVAAQGTYDTLAASGLDFATLLAEGAAAEGGTPPPPSPALAPPFPDPDNEKDPVVISFRARQLSIHSVSSVDNVSAVAPPAGREEGEGRAGGAVGARVYAAYARAAGPTTLLLAVAVLAQVAASGADYWTSYWVNLEEARTQNMTLIQSQMDSWNATEAEEGILSKSPADMNIMFADVGLSRYDCIYIYTGIIAALVIITLVRSYLFFWMAMRASSRLHSKMFAAVTRAPMRFFHANPSGRILNRFSKDMGAVDEVLPAAMLDVLQIGLSLMGIVTVVGIVNYWLLLPTLIIGVLFWGLRVVYLNTSRSIKRLEGITRSPVFSHLNATLQGITTIRAFNAQDALIREFDHHQDLHSTAWYLFIATSRAFGFWLDVICVLYIAFVTLSFLVFETDEFGGNVGLAITQAMGLTGMFQWGMRQSTELENQMTSVERIMEYTDIEPEPPLQSAAGRKPPASWPEEGRVVFKHVYLRYKEGEEPVLRGLSFEVLGGEKVGIVGRTGAGKSSLINALFRLAIVEGSIVIDGRDTASLGLHELRSQISIIPQEPVLFSGTVRHNLDPFDEYPDSVLWRALEEVELLEAVSELAGGLSGRLAEGGSNFSVGQRQLVCLARALVRRNRLLVLDEATANVDPQTDALIQSAIRSKFAECTVLTIAHRLHTVMDSDKVLVMDAGRVVEFAHPHLLLQREGGVLHSMVQHTGAQMADVLATVAQQNYIKKFGHLEPE